MTRYRDTVVQLLGGIHDRLVSKVVDGAEAGDQTIVEGVRRAKVSSGSPRWTSAESLPRGPKPIWNLAAGCGLVNMRNRNQSSKLKSLIKPSEILSTSSRHSLKWSDLMLAHGRRYPGAQLARLKNSDEEEGR
jgi:hypothetical protein